MASQLWTLQAWQHLVLCPDPTLKRGRGIWHYLSHFLVLLTHQLYDLFFFFWGGGGIMQSLIILATCMCTLILAVSVSHMSECKPAT